MNRQKFVTVISVLCIGSVVLTKGCGDAHPPRSSGKGIAAKQTAIYGTLQCLSSVDGDPEVRVPAARSLAYLKGNDAQAFRMLLWATEKSDEVRQILTKQIFARSSLPSKDLRAALHRLMSLYGKKEQQKRLDEIAQAASASLRAVKESAREPQAPLFGGIFKILVEPPKPEKRLRVYSMLEKERGIPEEVLARLWAVETDPPLRRVLLVTYRSNELGASRHSRKHLLSLCRGFSEAEAKVRSNEVSMLYDERADVFMNPENLRITKSEDGSSTVLICELPGSLDERMRYVRWLSAPSIQRGERKIEPAEFKVESAAGRILVSLLLDDTKKMSGADARLVMRVVVDRVPYSINHKIRWPNSDSGGTQPSAGGPAGGETEPSPGGFIYDRQRTLQKKVLRPLFGEAD